MNILRRRYFTLLEVVIAAVILSGMAAALYAFSSYSIDAWQQLQIRRNQLNELMVVDRAIEGMLPNALPFDWPDPESELHEEIPVLVAQADSFRCAYLHRLNDLEEGAIRFAELYVEDNQLVLQYSDRPFIDWQDAGERIWKTILAQEVESIEFLYADWDSDITSDNWAEHLVWVDSWDNVDIERSDLPLAVRLVIHWSDGRTYTWLRRTMGNGYRERYGKWEAPKKNEK